MSIAELSNKIVYCEYIKMNFKNLKFHFSNKKDQESRKILLKIFDIWQCICEIQINSLNL